MLRIGILASVVVLSAATALPAQDKPVTEDDYYRLLTFTVPKGVVLEAGAFAFMPDNKVVVSSRRGEIYLIENAYSKDASKVTFKRYAQGLHEVLGLDYRDGWLYVTQRPEVSRIKDTTGDGKADLMDSTVDALASTANFLQKAGWQARQPWGFEVRLPAGTSVSGEGRRTKRSMSEWASRGLRRVDGSPLPTGLGSAGLMTPAGAEGPAFLVLRNFDAIYSYNAAESYGLAIAHLADRLRGGGPFTTPWPTDDPGISRAERRELQGLLILRGHEIGEVDGMLGEKSRAAIKLEQERLGHEATGRGGQKILRALRGS